MGLFDEHARGTNLLDTGLISTTCSGARTAGTSRSVPSSRSSTRSCSASPAWRRIRSSPGRWTETSGRISRAASSAVRGKTRDEWCAIMEHTDVCFKPVLTMSEAAAHPHNVDRGTFIDVGGVVQPAPLPASHAPQQRSAALRPLPVSTLARSSPTGASSPARSTSCLRPGS